MAPTRSRLLSNRLSSRNNANDYNFSSTPVEAVVVPIGILILLLASAATISVYRYWRRKNDRDALINTNKRKFIPNWLSNWLGSSSSKSTPRHSSGSHPPIIVSTGTPGGLNDVYKHEPDSESDVMPLRSVSVYIPAYPLTVHDPYDRYPRPGVSMEARPKVFGGPYR